jgi:hypothetical protein
MKINITLFFIEFSLLNLGIDIAPFFCSQVLPNIPPFELPLVLCFTVQKSAICPQSGKLRSAAMESLCLRRTETMIFLHEPHQIIETAVLHEINVENCGLVLFPSDACIFKSRHC